MTTIPPADALAHLDHHRVASLEDALPLVGFEWTVFHLPPAKASKPALYGRMWKLRERGWDAMVRQLGDEYVLVARRYA